jgi:GTPase
VPAFRSGFVAVVGRPNVGKSTLINYLVGSEVSIISSKPETTRRRISGVIHGDNFQIVLVDTPGVSTIRHALGKRLRQVVNDETEEADAVIFMVDVSQNPVDEDREAASLVRDLKCPKFLVANKTDRLRNKESMIPALHAYGQLMDFKEVYPVSAQSGENVDKILATLVDLLPEGVEFFPKDMTSDLDQGSLIEDLIRLQVLQRTREELPHAVAVKLEEIKPGDNPDVTLIRAVIYVEKDSQRKILIGKKGGMLKQIGQGAREDIEKRLGRRVFLDLWVKVKEDWRQRPDWVEVLF